MANGDAQILAEALKPHYRVWAGSARREPELR